MRVQAAAAAEADAAAQQHGLTTSAFRTKYYWGPAVLGPKQVKSSNPFALDVQRSITQQGSSTAPGAAAVCAGRQASVHSMLGQGVKEQLRKGPTREASGQGAACHATPSAQHGQCSSGSGSASLGGCAQQVMGAAAGAGNREGSAATIVGSGALCAGDAARTVPLARAYEQSRRLAVQMFQQPVSEQVGGVYCYRALQQSMLTLVLLRSTLACCLHARAAAVTAAAAAAAASFPNLLRLS